MPPARKRQKTTAAVEEITFDLAAREEYLTGFHKRKLERAKHAQEIAKEKERKEKIEERRQLREQRAHDLEKHVETVNAMIRKANGEEDDQDASSDNEGEDEEWGGIEEPAVVAHEDEYIDEDKYTTVTVEAVDITRDGFVGLDAEEENAVSTTLSKESDGTVADKEKDNGKRKWAKEKPRDKAKKKKIKFRYETKAERKVTREKQKTKGRSQARARRERQ